ncbi:MAG: methyl-accepting chemotaxis protein [Allosphingosinicella sp.]|uniref:methyl-accepting chemotaxis protein n=1 Tax=Allosphingosinicella sp. TaxID=2823234 RepID=UPI00394D2680
MLGRFATSDIAVEWLVQPIPRSETYISERVCIRSTARLVDAVEMFQNAPELRLLPVVDDHQRPIGAVFEQQMRGILFNPFGHALLKNPSYGDNLRRHIRPCPIVEAGSSTELMLDVYARQQGNCEGLIVTRHGKFAGVIGDKVLLHLAAERDAEIARERSARYDRIEQASASFRGEVSRLAAELTAMADKVSGAAASMGERARSNGDHSAMVANAASQVACSMKEIAGRSRILAGTFQQVEERTAEAKQVATRAVGLVGEGGRQVQTLSLAAEEIGEVTELIDTIARKSSMLSINATIEAARAGDAGKGFSVVATEVKSLAAQTRTAAAKISQRILNIRAAISHVSEGHGGMNEIVHSVEEMSASTFEAMQDLRTAMEFIARNVEEAGTATQHIDANAARISGTASQAAEAAGELLGMASGVSDQGHTVQCRVLEFLELVRTA